MHISFRKPASNKAVPNVVTKQHQNKRVLFSLYSRAIKTAHKTYNFWRVVEAGAKMLLTKKK